MISGAINQDLEAFVQIEVLGPTGKSLTVDALLDTGFNGYLTLTPKDVATIGLLWSRRDQGTLADGSIQLFDVYQANVVWNGGHRVIEVQSIDAEHLLGMSLLLGRDVLLQVAVGGFVTISATP